MKMIYCSAQTLAKAVDHLQCAFNVVQKSLSNKKIVLNAEKTKCMLFSNVRSRPLNIPSLVTLEGRIIERVNSYRYLSILNDGSLTFKPHVQSLVKKLRLKLSFYFKNKLLFF